MTPLIKSLLLAVAALAAVPAQAALNVVACEPEWASLVKELGGDKVNVSSTTTAQQDPHHIEARPSLIARMRTPTCSSARAWSRDRLAAAPDPAVGQPAPRRRRAGQLRGPAASSRRSRCRRVSTAARATSTPPATRTSSSIRATSPRSRPRSQRGWHRSTPPTRRPTSSASPRSRRAGARRSASGSSRRSRCAACRSSPTTRT